MREREAILLHRAFLYNRGGPQQKRSDLQAPSPSISSIDLDLQRKRAILMEAAAFFVSHTQLQCTTSSKVVALPAFDMEGDLLMLPVRVHTRDMYRHSP